MMRSRLHFFLHSHYTKIKHIVYISVGILLLVFSLVSLGNQNRLLERNQQLTEATKQLSADNKTLNLQSKALATQNQQIAKTSQEYLRCIARIFADYTNNRQPITIKDLDSCTVTTTATTGNTSGGNTSATSTVPLASQPSSSSSPQNSPSPPPKQPDNSPPPPKTLLDQALGIVNEAERCLLGEVLCR